MTGRWGALVLAVWFSGACGEGSYPGPDTRQTCAEMGWVCGVDDYGNTCGSCVAEQSCSDGICRGGSTTRCSGISCGSDAYGNFCGSCPSGQSCNAGVCRATPPTCTCGVRTCGPNSCGLSSCGTCATGQTCNPSGACVSSAMERLLANGDSPLFRGDYGVPFTLPVQASVGYVAQSAEDTFLFGIFPANDWALFMRNDSSARAYGAAGPTNYVSNGVTLPAGNYVLGFRCSNLVQRCAISYTAVTSY